MVVVGIGNSGGDIAVEISRSAEKVRQEKRRASLLFGKKSRDLRDKKHVLLANPLIHACISMLFVNVFNFQCAMSFELLTLLLLLVL